MHGWRRILKPFVDCLQTPKGYVFINRGDIKKTEKIFRNFLNNTHVVWRTLIRKKINKLGVENNI